MEQQKITMEKPEAVKQQNWFLKKLTGKLLPIMIKGKKTKTSTNNIRKNMDITFFSHKSI